MKQKMNQIDDEIILESYRKPKSKRKCLEELPFFGSDVSIGTKTATLRRDSTMPVSNKKKILNESLMRGSHKAAIREEIGKAFPGSCCLVTDEFVAGFAVRISTAMLLTAWHVFADVAYDVEETKAKIKVASLDKLDIGVQVTVDFSILSFSDGESFDVVLLEVAESQKAFSMLGLAIAKLSHPTLEGALISTIILEQEANEFNFFKTFGRLGDIVDWFQQYHTASTTPGSSGAPLYYNGCVVAIHLGYDEPTDRNTCVPVDFIRLLNLTEIKETPYVNRGNKIVYVPQNTFHALNKRYNKPKHGKSGGGGGNFGGYSVGVPASSFGTNKILHGASLKKGFDHDWKFSDPVPSNIKITGVSMKQPDGTKKELVIAVARDDNGLKPKIYATKPGKELLFMERDLELSYWLNLRRAKYLEDHPNLSEIPPEIQEIQAWDKKTFLGQTIPPHLRASLDELQEYQRMKQELILEDEVLNTGKTDVELSKLASVAAAAVRARKPDLLKESKKKSASATDDDLDFHPRRGETPLPKPPLKRQEDYDGQEEMKISEPVVILAKEIVPPIKKVIEVEHLVSQKIPLEKTLKEEMTLSFQDQITMIHSIRDSINSRITKMEKVLLTLLENSTERPQQCELGLKTQVMKQECSSSIAEQATDQTSQTKLKSLVGPQEAQRQRENPSIPTINLDLKTTEHQQEKSSEEPSVNSSNATTKSKPRRLRRRSSKNKSGASSKKA
jgi:hypothetical protein